ncbi:MAG: biopolymer transporter ExbD [Deltaproteobacteria bacterium]|nr:MAG: biopolymer transporter ExbD [Deltaproteobacteria bacterium]
MGAQIDDDDEITTINVTPLVDITLVLLIIFMVTTSVIANPEGIEIDKPDAKTGQPLSKETNQVVVKCYRDGTFAIAGSDARLDEAELAAALAEAAKAPDAQGVVVCEEQAPAGSMIRVIDLMRQAGIKKYGVATERPPEPAPAAAG